MNRPATPPRLSLGIHYGALASPLAEQLKAFSFLDKNTVAAFQKHADAITMLYLQSILSEKETAIARGRLQKKIYRCVEANAPWAGKGKTV